MSLRVNAPTDTEANPARDTEVDAALALVARNPVMQTPDKTGLPPARKFKGHKAVADSIAQALRTGDMFAFVQPSSRGFWASEWSVLANPDGTKVAARRRAGHGSTVTSAVDDMLRHPSFHSSHYFRPEEGILGWYRRK